MGCGLVMAALLIAASSITVWAQENRRIARMPPDTSVQWSVVIPTPQFLPAGYELFRVFREPVDGFMTGNAEIEFDYIDKSCWARGMICPLQVFVSPITTNPFAGTVGRKSELLSMWIGNRTVEAQYFIGNGNVQPEGEKPRSTRQRLQADAHDYNANLNSLVFPFDGFMIGIRGSKLGGVDRAELI
ncbi:MAG TPA: hypothetical protein VFJ52_13410, partial [Terriglobia bacterium]|nr:hypothetical protein [Terriglobia bacterium]